MNIEEFREYVKGKYFGSLPANKLVVHHTWKPTVEQWQGSRSVSGLKSYYEGKGWTSGPHLFVAPDGIWLFSDMRYDGTHAGVGNFRSIGIEVVGNYDQKVWSGAVKANALATIAALRDKLSLTFDQVKFHRDYAPYKTCPGKAITRDWLQNQLSQLNNSAKAGKIVEKSSEDLINDSTNDSKTTPKTKEPMISDRLQSAIEKLTGKRYWSDFSEAEQEAAARELEEFYQKYHQIRSDYQDLKDQQSTSSTSATSSSKKTDATSASSTSTTSTTKNTKPYSEFNWLEKVIWNVKNALRKK